MNHKKKFPFNLEQLFAGFCPPSAVDHFGIVDDSSIIESNYDTVNAKGVPSVMVVESPMRQPNVIEESPTGSRPEDTAPFNNDGSDRREPPEEIPTHTNVTCDVATESTDCGLTDKPPSTNEEDTTTEYNSNQTILRSMAVISILLLSFVVIFNRSNIEAFSHDAILGLDDKRGLNMNAYFRQLVSNAASKSVREAGIGSLAEPQETSQDKTGEKSQEMDPSAEKTDDDAKSESTTLQYPPNDIKREEHSTGFAGDTISSQDHDDLPEAQNHNGCVDETEENESVTSPSKRDIIDEDHDDLPEAQHHNGSVDEIEENDNDAVDETDENESVTSPSKLDSIDEDHDDLPEAKRHNGSVDEIEENGNNIVDETEENESVTRPSKLDGIDEEDSTPKLPNPKDAKEDKRIRFFKLETDETGSYLVSCEKSLHDDTYDEDTLPEFVCSEMK